MGRSIASARTFCNIRCCLSIATTVHCGRSKTPNNLKFNFILICLKRDHFKCTGVCFISSSSSSINISSSISDGNIIEIFDIISNRR